MVGYISEYSYFGFADTEFIEIAVPEGTDVSGYSVVLYQSDGTIIESYSLGSVQNTIAANDVYVIDDGTPGFSTMDGSGEIWSDDAIALVDDNGNVVQFLSHDGNTVTATEGPAAGMTSTNTGSVSNMGDSMESSDQGASYQAQSSPNKGTIPCFGPGTRIATRTGFKTVESLRPGDEVRTSQGFSPILWIWSGEQPLDGVRSEDKPVEIKSGALGQNQPTRSLVLSPQHRVLLGGRGNPGHVDECEVLAPAKALTSLVGIRSMQGKRAIRWYHFACAAHELVLAEGAWVESLLLGPMVLAGLPRAHRKHLAQLFPNPADPDCLNGPPARPCLSVRQARDQVLAAFQHE